MIKTANRIQEVIENKGFKSIKPSEDQLRNMTTTMSTWNKWVLKKKDPSLIQLSAIAEFLRCEVSELISLNGAK